MALIADHQGVPLKAAVGRDGEPGRRDAADADVRIDDAEAVLGRQLRQQTGHEQRLLVAVGLVVLQGLQGRSEVVHLLGRGGDAAQPLLQQGDAGGEILGRKLLCQGFEVSLELIEQLGVVGAHAGQLLIGRVHAGLDPHLVEGVLLILPVGLPELGGFEAAVVQGKGLFQVAELGGRLRAVLVDLVDAVVEARTDVGVECFQREVEGGVELCHLVTAG